MQKRTLVILIETDCPDSEVLGPHTVRALREYADALESGPDDVGSTAIEEWKTSNGKSTLRIVHGQDILY